MSFIARIIAFSVALLASSSSLAGERNIRLAVDKMTCASCPYIVKQALTRVSGVKHANVSFEEKIAMVTFDDAATSAAQITKATADVGFPSRVIDK